MAKTILYQSISATALQQGKRMLSLAKVQVENIP
jgi:hypothetical protein